MGKISFLVFMLIGLVGNLVAYDGEALKVELVDSNNNSKIDEVYVTVVFSSAIKATGIFFDGQRNHIYNNFKITDKTSGEIIPIKNIVFAKAEVGTATFKILLDESNENLSMDTSATALNVVYKNDGKNALIIKNFAIRVDIGNIDLIEIDKARPSYTVQAILNKDGKEEIIVTFNEFIKMNSLIKSTKLINTTISLTDNSKGDSPKILNLTNATVTTEDNKIFKIQLNRDLDNSYFVFGKLIELSFNGVVDEFNNVALNTKSYAEISETEKQMPIVNPVLINVKNNYLELKFSEMVDKGLAEDATNYNLSGALTGYPTSVSLQSDNKTAYLIIDNLKSIKTDTNLTVTIYNITDLSGNNISDKKNVAIYSHIKKQLIYSSKIIDVASSPSTVKSSTINIELQGETFLKTGVLTNNTDYSISGLPMNLEAILTIKDNNISMIINEKSKSTKINTVITLKFLNDLFKDGYASTIKDFEVQINLNYFDGMGALDNLYLSKWQQITVPSGVRVKSYDMMNSGLVSAIWSYDNGEWISMPEYLDAGKGYWIMTNAVTGNLSKVAIITEGATIRDSKSDDLQAIKSTFQNQWVLLGTTHTLEFAEAYQNANGCVAQVYYYDAIKETWNTTENIPAHSGFWVKQICKGN